MLDSRISNNFIKHGFTDGISYKVFGGNLTIYIDSNKNSLYFFNNNGFVYFNIGIRKDIFWIEDVFIEEDKTIYVVSNIVQQIHDVNEVNEINICSSKKVSDIFPGITHADTITVVVSRIVPKISDNNECSSKKVSDVLPSITYADTITNCRK